MMALVPGTALGNELDCGNPFVNHFGPFDYRTATDATKHLVESFHFNPGTEQLKNGFGTGYPAGDIAYTLHVFPNHPRALMAMARLGLRDKTPKPKWAAFSVECYFDRAMRFRPDDYNVYLVYGIYLMDLGKTQDAVTQLEHAAELSGENANVHYNLGLAYFALKNYEKALDQAHRAYALGFPLPGLRAKLEKAGKWQSVRSADSPAPGG
jgi:tetratricopeptide (TPR) repeat protein